MAPRTVKNSKTLAQRIKARRQELGMSIEEAAQHAGIGTKTWSRYESGGSIRTDLVKQVCRVLGWRSLDDPIDLLSKSDTSWLDEIDASHPAWSESLYQTFGKKVAVSFAVGSDILLGDIEQDLIDLRSLPRGTHLGELPSSSLADTLPEQFMMLYDYDFLYRLRCALIQYRARARYDQSMMAHTVAEEYLVRQVYKLSYELISSWKPTTPFPEQDDDQFEEAWDEWPYELCGDDDYSIYLSNDSVLPEGDEYHFNNWFVQQFWTGRQDK